MTPDKHVNRGWHSRGYLPHFDVAEMLQMVGFRLHDSLPAEKVREFQAALKQCRSEEARNELYKKVEKWIDAGLGACWLRNPRIAEIVQDALFHFDGARYKLLEWVILPNHVHVLLETHRDFSLTRVVQTWKSFTAKTANAILKRQGVFWAADYFDRYIRNEQHYYFAVEYIRNNPVKAGLRQRAEEWPFGSACFRAR